MPSLKDLRNRIASVKSTQKITKAMQMVAVSKLRRAQAAAESARPYADKVETVLFNLAAASNGDAAAPRLLTGSGSDQIHLLIVCTAERGLCGGFNTSIVRLAREKANTLLAEGKTVRILCIGKKGFDQLRRTHEKAIIDVIDLRSVRNIGYGTAKPIAERIIEMFNNSEFDVCTLFYARFRSVISQIPTAQQLIPPELGARSEQAPAYDYEPDEVGDPVNPAAVGADRAHLSRAVGERRFVLRRADERDGQRDAQRRRNGEEIHAALQPHASGDDHQRAHRNHLGRRGALTKPIQRGRLRHGEC